MHSDIQNIDSKCCTISSCRMGSLQACVEALCLYYFGRNHDKSCHVCLTARISMKLGPLNPATSWSAMRLWNPQVEARLINKDQLAGICFIHDISCLAWSTSSRLQSCAPFPTSWWQPMSFNVLDAPESVILGLLSSAAWNCAGCSSTVATILLITSWLTLRCKTSGCSSY